MRTEIMKANAIAQIEMQEHCHILEVANDSGDESVSIARARVELGVITSLHSLRGFPQAGRPAFGVGSC